MAESKEHRDFLERSRSQFSRLMDDLDCILKEKAQEHDKTAKERVAVGALVRALIRTKNVADGKIECVANQGQALDGYSELANYRAIIDKLKEIIKGSQ
jgi:hypothetical protein